MKRPMIIPPPRPGDLPAPMPSIAPKYDALCLVVRSSKAERANAAAQAEHCLVVAAAYEESARVLRENAELFRRAAESVEVEL